MNKRKRLNGKKKDQVVFGESSQEKKLNRRRPKMSSNGSRTIEMSISSSNAVSEYQIEQFLRALKIVNGKEEIKLELDLPKVIPLKVTIKREVEHIKQNG